MGDGNVRSMGMDSVIAKKNFSMFNNIITVGAKEINGSPVGRACIYFGGSKDNFIFVGTFCWG